MTGYHNVAHVPGKSKPFHAKVRRGGKRVHLGAFSTVEEAALCFARSPEGQAAKRRNSNAASTGEEELQQAEDEGLVLRVANCKSGYFGVHRQGPYYLARVKKGAPGLVRHCRGRGDGRRAIWSTIDVSLFYFLCVFS